MKICTYNNINKWQQQTTLEHTYDVTYYYCVNHRQNKFTSISHNNISSSIKTSLHVILRRPCLVIEQWVYPAHNNSKSHSNEDNYSLPYQNMGTARPLLPAYSMKLSFQHFSSSQDAHSGKCDIHMSPIDYRYKSGTIKKVLWKSKLWTGCVKFCLLKFQWYSSSPPIKYNMVSQDQNLNTQCHENPKSYNACHVNNLLR